MANHEQKVICEFLALMKTNPNALSSVLQTTQLQAAITSNEQTDALNSSSTSSRSTSSSPTSDEECAQNTGAVDIVSTGTTAYSAEDLLAKRGAKGKGSKAQQTFRFVLRESARKCGMWENPPLLREINMKTLEVFTKKMNKYKDEACQRPVVVAEENSTPVNTTLIQVEQALKVDDPAGHDQVEEDDQDTGFSFTSSEELFVMDGARKIARATFLRTSKADSDFKKLVMQSNFLKSDDKVELTGPNTEKYLCEIQVGQKFYWPENQLLKHVAKSKQSKPKEPEKTATQSNPKEPEKKATQSKPKEPEKKAKQSKPKEPEKMATQSKPKELEKTAKQSNKPKEPEKTAKQSKPKEPEKMATQSKPKELEKTATQSKPKEPEKKATQSKPKEPEKTAISKESQDLQVTPADKQTEPTNYCKYKGYVYVPVGEAVHTPAPLPAKRRRMVKVSLDFDYI
ncbi:putative uncharacterized protein DDB_G0271982 [Montipora foliosa]|uniref:putative uncharacterized protein DDB_G0271982 n=1 Tax=Montipora foliosa TaxID=591990 RepID=UPI0035F1A858